MSNYYVGNIVCTNELTHHGIIGQRWGFRRFQNPDGSLTPEGRIRYSRHNNSDKMVELLDRMKSIRYDDFTSLKSPDQVRKSKKGSCHDQVMMEMDELRKMGKQPHGIFVMEYDNNNRGGMTHSLAYYAENGKINWVENAWSERAGVNSYNSIKDIKNEIKKAHKSGEFGNKKQYGNIVFGTFNDSEHKVGESLQDLVDICLR